MIKNKTVISLLFILSYIALCGPYLFAQSLNSTDIVYLQKLYTDTFHCIKYFTNKKSGFPYDVSDYRPATSISNIGLYMASLAIASETGLFGKKEAADHLKKTLTSLEKIQKWNGFPITWVNVKTGEREFESHFSYADHIGNLACSLIVVAKIFPKQLGIRINRFIDAMNFSPTYDKKTGWLKGGYDIAKKDFTVKQSWGDWYYNFLASDTRHFSLLGIALEQIPEKHWKKLNRKNAPWGPLDKLIFTTLSNDQKVKGFPYYLPGMEGGGLFMQYLPGIFLNEVGLPMDQSAKNFAYCQIQLTKQKQQYPFWGFSACQSPDGTSYVGWGKLDLAIVTPHAIVLSIKNFPKEAIDALKALEIRGCRQKHKKKNFFGFTDSYHIKKKQASSQYLMLDQCMLFLSLANFLHNDIVRTSFGSHHLGKKTNDTLKRLEKKYPSPQLQNLTP